MGRLFPLVCAALAIAVPSARAATFSAVSEVTITQTSPYIAGVTVSYYGVGGVASGTASPAPPGSAMASGSADNSGPQNLQATAIGNTATGTDGTASAAIGYGNSATIAASGANADRFGTIAIENTTTAAVVMSFTVDYMLRAAVTADGPGDRATAMADFVFDLAAETGGTFDLAQVLVRDSLALDTDVDGVSASVMRGDFFTVSIGLDAGQTYYFGARGEASGTALSVAAIALPASAPLLLVGLAGIGWAARRRRLDA